jgi:hypothetical protein
MIDPELWSLKGVNLEFSLNFLSLNAKIEVCTDLEAPMWYQSDDGTETGHPQLLSVDNYWE